MKWIAGFVGVAAMTLGGCSAATMKAFDVTIERDAALQDSLVRVDLAGVNDANKANWDDKADAMYWQRDDPEAFRNLNDAHIRSIEFPAGDDDNVRALAIDDPVWEVWREDRARWLFILADLPDRRARQAVSLRSCDWSGKTAEIRLRVNSAGVWLDTPPDGPGR